MSSSRFISALSSQGICLSFFDIFSLLTGCLVHGLVYIDKYIQSTMYIPSCGEGEEFARYTNSPL